MAVAAVAVICVYGIPLLAQQPEDQSGSAGETVRASETVEVSARTDPFELPRLSSIVLDASELSVLGQSARRWIDVSSDAAGVFLGAKDLRIDGMPTASYPDAALIAAISINADPFSAEFGGVERNYYDITLREPARVWRFNMNGSTWNRGGLDLLTPSSSRTRNRSAGVAGPVPHTPLTMFVQASTHSSERDLAFVASDEHARGFESVSSTLTNTTLSVGTTVKVKAIAVTITAGRTEMANSNAGAGGFVTPEAAGDLRTSSETLQTTWRAGSTILHRGGISFSKDRLGTSTNGTERAVSVIGQRYTGGSEYLAESRRETAWSARHVAASAGQRNPWRAGIEITHGAVSDARTANPLGLLRLSSYGDAFGTLILRESSPIVAPTATTAAGFFERGLLSRDTFALRLGVRGDWQRGEGLYVSPRATGTKRLGRFIAESSAGVFVDSWSPGLMAEIIHRSGILVPTLVMYDVPVYRVGAGASEHRLHLQVDDTFVRRRDIVVQNAIRRRVGAVELGAEERWTRGMKLAGLRRVRLPEGLLDVLDADRHLSRHQLHVRAAVVSQRVSLTAHYQTVWSHDDTDGTFSHAAGDVSGEWGRSTAVARHYFSMVTSLTLPGAVHTMVTASAASGSPFTAITGRDPDGLATFVDRGGLRRNSALAPGHATLSMYGSRRIAVPRLYGFAFDIGVQAENLLNRTNATEVGHVLGTPLFGQSVAALAGRSIHVWTTLSR